MASASPRKGSKILKAPRRVFNRIFPSLHSSSPRLPETSTLNVPHEDPGVVGGPSCAISSTPHRPHPSSQCSSDVLSTDSTNENSKTPRDVEGNRAHGVIVATPQRSSFLPETHKVKKAWDVTRSGLVTALRLLEKSADAFPPLKSVVGGLVACLDLAQVSYGCGLNTLSHV